MEKLDQRIQLVASVEFNNVVDRWRREQALLRTLQRRRDMLVKAPLDDDDRMPWLDLVAPTPSQLEAAARHIARLQPSGPVLVACALGYSRSASAVAAWLITTRRAASVDEAVTILQRARPRVVLGPAHRRALASLNPIAEISGGA